MIPLQYRLREAVRIRQIADAEWLVESDAPLAVLTVNAAAARFLERTRGGASLSDIAAVAGLPTECVLILCEHFRSRGVLEVARASAEREHTPAVTVIIPTRDRAADLDECLAAVLRLDYPRGLLEVMVIDDGSRDRDAIEEVAARHGARLLTNETNRGPSYSRNRAAKAATGEILAFVDSDCVPGPDWLSDLVPYLAWDRVGAVGGRTIAHYTESPLDRYEEVASPLDMGKRLRVGATGTDTFYVPTCNLLVRRILYQQLDGLREDLLVGEDVDFCWRLRAAGAYLVYAPEGIVRHKHRDSLGSMLRRRASYGISEAALHALHPDKRKRFPLAPAPLATVALLSTALVRLEPRLLPACLLPPLWEGGCRALHLRRKGARIATGRIWSSVLRGHVSMLYFAYFHLVRYYLGPLAAAGLVTRGAWVLAVVAALYSSALDYSTGKPRLPYLAFLGYFLADHAAYQAGVIVGCIKTGSLRSYLPALQRGPATPPPLAT